MRACVRFDAGEYYLLFALCDPSFKDSVTVTGSSVWMNPYGHLPGRMYGFLPFYGILGLLYITLALFWVVLNACYWKEVLHLQHCISGVILMCCVEMAVWYFEFLNFNRTGTRTVGKRVSGLLGWARARLVGCGDLRW